MKARTKQEEHLLQSLDRPGCEKLRDNWGDLKGPAFWQVDCCIEITCHILEIQVGEPDGIWEYICKRVSHLLPVLCSTFAFSLVL